MKHDRQPFSDLAAIPRAESPGEIRFVRERPRMSLHRFAQYIESSPTQRRQLIEYAKYPSPFRVDYAPATRLFAESLRLGWDGDLLTSVALQRWWDDHEPASDYAAFRRMQAMDAVDAFSQLVDRVSRDLCRLGARVRLANWLWLPLNFGGVKIADSPILVLERELRSAEVSEPSTEVGLISFHVSKSRPHTPESAKQAAVLAWALARLNRRRQRTEIAPRLCLVVDVFTGLIVDANRGRKRRLWQSEVACDEIAAMWSEL